ncbi:hypothetical protein C8R47DRAFT_1196404 [Mycena vitilis]|nr:hypothetical protein C8R47DRAFT_1196404 [Mycena vitilis]
MTTTTDWEAIAISHKPHAINSEGGSYRPETCWRTKRVIDDDTGTATSTFKCIFARDPNTYVASIETVTKGAVTSKNCTVEVVPSFRQKSQQFLQSLACCAPPSSSPEVTATLRVKTKPGSDGTHTWVHSTEADVKYYNHAFVVLRKERCFIRLGFPPNSPAGASVFKLITTAALAILPTTSISNPDWVRLDLDAGEPWVGIHGGQYVPTNDSKLQSGLTYLTFRGDITQATYTAPILEMRDADEPKPGPKHASASKRGSITVTRTTKESKARNVATVTVEEFHGVTSAAITDRAQTREGVLRYAKFQDERWYIDQSLPATEELYRSLAAAILATRLYGSDTVDARFMARTLVEDNRVEEEESVAMTMAVVANNRLNQDKDLERQQEQLAKVWSDNRLRLAKIVGAQEAGRQMIQAKPKGITNQPKSGQSLRLPTTGGGSEDTRGPSRNAQVSGSSQRRR